MPEDTVTATAAASDSNPDSGTPRRGGKTAEIIAIGTELTSGAKLDTNSQWLSRELSDRGIAVRFHTTVADDYAENVAAVREAIRRADVVLMTGGLGPTRDDITRDVFAEAIGVDTVEDPEAVAHLTAFFESRGRRMPERNLLQARKPRGADLLANPVGTAPGLARLCDRPGRNDGSQCLVVAMPGVPSEMKPMFLTHVAPRLPTAGCIARRVINCYGIGESAAEERLGELTERGRDPEVGITASAATISLRVLAAGATPEEAAIKADAAEAEVRQRLGDYVFGVDSEDVEHALMKTLIDRDLTLATFEAGSGGELAMRLDRVDPPAGGLTGSIAADGGHHAKPPIDRVRSVVGGATGEISLAAAEHFAREAAETADCGLAIVADRAVVTAVPTPNGAVGYIAATLPGGETVSDELTLLGNPAIHRQRLAKSVMNLLRTAMNAPS